MSETVSAVAVATVLLAIVGMVSLRRMLLKAAYRAMQLLVSAGVAISAVMSYKPHWLPPEAGLALNNLRPAFAGNEQQFFIVIASVLLLIGLPLLAYLDGARRADDLTLSVRRLTSVCQQIERLGHPAVTTEHTAPVPPPEQVGQALTVLADVSRYVAQREHAEKPAMMIKDYFVKPQ